MIEVIVAVAAAGRQVGAGSLLGELVADDEGVGHQHLLAPCLQALQRQGCKSRGKII